MTRRGLVDDFERHNLELVERDALTPGKPLHPGIMLALVRRIRELDALAREATARADAAEHALDVVVSRLP